MIEVMANFRYNEKAGFQEKYLKIIGCRKEEKEWKIRKDAG
jgi:hypothetical protein